MVRLRMLLIAAGYEDADDPAGPEITANPASLCPPTASARRDCDACRSASNR